MIPRALLLLLLALGLPSGGWRYHRLADLPEPGSCNSAARIGRHLAVGCRRGVWLGAPEALLLALPCAARDDWPNRVRVFDGRRIIASTPCGLYLLEEGGGPPQRLPISDPWALDADGAGMAVVANGEGLWRIDREGMGRLPQGCVELSPSIEVEAAAEAVLLLGERPTLIGVGTEAGCTPVPWRGLVTLFPDGRMLLVDSSGEGWTWRPGQPEQEAWKLPLQPAEKLLSLVDLGGRNLVMTNRRWFHFGEGGRQQGPHPGSPEDLVPVRGGVAGQPPWLVGRQGVFEPERVAVDQARCAAVPLDQVLAASPSRRLILPRPPPAWATWLPQLVVGGGQSQVKSVFWTGDGGWTSHSGCAFYAGLNLVWALDPRHGAERAYEGARLAVRRDQVQMENRLFGLLSAWEESCQGVAGSGESDSPEALDQAELGAQVQLLLSAGDGRMPWDAQ